MAFLSNTAQVSAIKPLSATLYWHTEFTAEYPNAFS